MIRRTQNLPGRRSTIFSILALSWSVCYSHFVNKPRAQEIEIPARHCTDPLLSASSSLPMPRRSSSNHHRPAQPLPPISSYPLTSHEPSISPSLEALLPWETQLHFSTNTKGALEPYRCVCVCPERGFVPAEFMVLSAAPWRALGLLCSGPC